MKKSKLNMDKLMSLGIGIFIGATIPAIIFLVVAVPIILKASN